MKRKELLTILIPSLIFVISWIGFNIYHSSVTSTIPETLNVQISPISATFNTKIIADLKKREKVTPIFETGATSTSPSPTPSISQPTSSSQSATATSGGTLR